MVDTHILVRKIDRVYQTMCILFSPPPPIRHPALEEYDYYWRFETGTEYLCPMAYDPFKLMYDHNKKISFSMALYEYEETIPSLWNTTLDYIQKHPGSVQVNKPGGLWKFITDADGSFNRCHFWSNFEVS